MRKIILLVVLFSVWQLQSALCGELPAHKDSVDFDAEIQDMTVEIQNLQITFFADKGRYFQGIATPDTVGRIEENRKTFSKTKKPTDQNEDWADFGLPNKNLRAQWRVDVYDGPQGIGYVIITRIRYPNGKVFLRRLNVGPEEHKNTDNWIEEVSAEE